MSFLYAVIVIFITIRSGFLFNFFTPYCYIDKELSAAKERQEIELAAQRVTLQEQRTHINILDTALQNAQSNVVRLEEEV